MVRNAPRTLRTAAIVAALIASPLVLAGAPAGVVQDTLKRPAPPPVDTQARPAAPEPAAAAPRAAQPGERTVVVQRFEFVGNAQVPSDALHAAVARFLNVPLTIEQLFDVADAATAAYRERGFGLATVVVPAQRIDSGTVRLEVIEGAIAGVMFDGNSSYSSKTLGRFATGVVAGEVYRSEAVEGAVLRLNDLPGLEARAVVQPGASYGTSDLLFKVIEDPSEFTLSADDHGRDAIGRERLVFDATFHNLSGDADQLRLGLVHAEAGLLDYVNLTYGMPLNYEGDRIALTVNYADYAVDDPAFLALGVTGDNLNARLDFTSPLDRTRYDNLVLLGALAYSATETELALLSTTTSTDLVWAEVGLFWNRVFADLSSLTLTTTLASNLRSQEPAFTDPDGIDSAAMKARLSFDASHLWQFRPGWALLTRLDGVWSPEPLPDIQRFSVGGPYSVRGYESSEARGDYGYHLAFELQKGFRAFGASHGVSLFVEGATVWTHDYAIGALPVPGTDLSLYDAGLRLDLNPQGRWGATLQYAVPIDDYVSPNTGDDGRLWASVVARF